jgi:hypothetical protein
MISILRKSICLFKFSSTPPALQWLSADSTMDVTMDIGIGCPAGAGQALRHQNPKEP